MLTRTRPPKILSDVPVENCEPTGATAGPDFVPGKPGTARWRNVDASTFPALTARQLQPAAITTGADEGEREEEGMRVAPTATSTSRRAGRAINRAGARPARRFVESARPLPLGEVDSNNLKFYLMSLALGGVGQDFPAPAIFAVEARTFRLCHGRSPARSIVGRRGRRPSTQWSARTYGRPRGSRDW